MKIGQSNRFNWFIFELHQLTFPTVDHSLSSGFSEPISGNASLDQFNWVNLMTGTKRLSLTEEFVFSVSLLRINIQAFLFAFRRRIEIVLTWLIMCFVGMMLARWKRIRFTALFHREITSGHDAFLYPILPCRHWIAAITATTSNFLWVSDKSTTRNRRSLIMRRSKWLYCLRLSCLLLYAAIAWHSIASPHKAKKY